ncbi:hypothetical protein BSP12_140 [Bacillus phage BSP12]|nr:hypothetical protein BSP12_140 [Bacillus phage BSP12]
MRYTDFTKEQQAAIKERAKKIIYKVVDRCYNPKHKQYSGYGGDGVTIHENWKNDYNQFVEDVVELPGFDYELFVSGKLELDKDTQVRGSKVYSKETCVLLTRKENAQYKPSIHKDFYAYNQYTAEIKEHYNKTLFAKENDLNPTVVSNVLNKRKKRAGDWHLWYKGEPAPVVYRIYARKDDKEVWDINPQRLSAALGYHEKAVAQVLSRYKGSKLHEWEISKEPVDLEALVRGK